MSELEIRRKMQKAEICQIYRCYFSGANFYRVLEQVRDRLRTNAVAIQLPIGSENQFQGIIDLVKMCAYI